MPPRELNTLVVSTSNQPLPMRRNLRSKLDAINEHAHLDVSRLPSVSRDVVVDGALVVDGIIWQRGCGMRSPSYFGAATPAQMAGVGVEVVDGDATHAFQLAQETVLTAALHLETAAGSRTSL